MEGPAPYLLCQMVLQMWLIQETHRAILCFFRVKKAPKKAIIQRWVKKFETFETVENIKSKSVRRGSYSGRPKTRTQEVINMMRESVKFEKKYAINKKKDFKLF